MPARFLRGATLLCNAYVVGAIDALLADARVQLWQRKRGRSGSVLVYSIVMSKKSSGRHRLELPLPVHLSMHSGERG